MSEAAPEPAEQSDDDPWVNEPEPERVFDQPVFIASRRPPPSGTMVYLNDKPLPLRYDVRNHSPTGFEWGYAGSGPSQLALAMLLAVTDHAEACREYQNFKRACVEHIAFTDWALPVADVTAWLERKRNSADSDSWQQDIVQVHQLWHTPPKSASPAPGNGHRPRNGALR